MPIIACPSCKGKLRFPDDMPPRRVKCPTCGNVFLSSAGADPAAPVAAGSAGSRSPRSDFEYDDRRDHERRRPRDDASGRDRRGRRQSEEDDDRGRRRDVAEDRRTRRGRYDDDDDDRPSRRRDEEEDDHDDRRRRGVDRRALEGQFDRASLACLLCFIAGWLLVGGLGLSAFARLLFWAELHEGVNVFRIVAGLLGIGHLLTAVVGFAFLISGPRARGALGLAIATTAVAAFHLILTTVLATTQSRALAGHQHSAGVAWEAFVSEGNVLGQLVFILIGFDLRDASLGGPAVLGVFTNLAEVARVVLFLLTLRAISREARDPRRAKMVMQALIANAVAAGALLLAGILFGLLLLAVRNERGGFVAVSNIYSLVVHLTLIAVAVWTTLVIKGVKDGIDYRPD